MELEDQNQTNLADIKFLEWRLIERQYHKLSCQEQYESEKAELEQKIQKLQLSQQNLKQQSWEGQLARAEKWFEDETKKELHRWKNLTPEEKIREHQEKIMLQNEEDWEPMTDIEVDRWIEEETEKEIERLEKHD